MTAVLTQRLRYHWSIIIAPKNSTNGTRYHAKAFLPKSPGEPVRWQYEEHDTLLAPIDDLLVLVCIGKIVNKEKVVTVLRETPLKGELCEGRKCRSSWHHHPANNRYDSGHEGEGEELERTDSASYAHSSPKLEQGTGSAESVDSADAVNVESDEADSVHSDCSGSVSSRATGSATSGDDGSLRSGHVGPGDAGSVRSGTSNNATLGDGGSVKSGDAGSVRSTAGNSTTADNAGNVESEDASSVKSGNAGGVQAGAVGTVDTGDASSVKSTASNSAKSGDAGSVESDAEKSIKTATPTPLVIPAQPRRVTFSLPAGEELQQNVVAAAPGRRVTFSEPEEEEEEEEKPPKEERLNSSGRRLTFSLPAPTNPWAQEKLDGEWNCVEWVKDALGELEHRTAHGRGSGPGRPNRGGKVLGRAVVGWRQVRDVAMGFLNRKRREGRWDDDGNVIEGEWNVDAVPTYDLLRGRETVS